MLALPLDVTNPEQIRNAVDHTIEKFKRIDVLVNNAGIGYFSSVEESVEEETRKMFEINFWGLMHITNAVLPYMRSQKSGHIINFSSIGGLTSFPTLGYYHATKYAVEGISESLAQELAPFNIYVTLMEPSSFVQIGVAVLLPRLRQAYLSLKNLLSAICCKVFNLVLVKKLEIL
ncbi:SDR family NAD(P)-dependent oxidoreductase [Paenibacillus polymyxa]|uniref:SDR family NAD(P)-dependent oxidoreductase n=1 Tax=Paenibacillus polymyxa TaxID=1406 RepID=UPI001F316693|nr:SDR family NAD(P)-dependent oxidoreductase [Paenibacillus polymyxa]MCJ1219383.1 SDR family NAD(P)-dependent oxidoreductase [Paenibacillus polymyxa]